MNLKKLLLTGLFPLAAFQVLASGDVIRNSDPLIKTFITNKHRVADFNYQAELLNTEAWQNFVQQNPQWTVYFNEDNQMPHRAYGAPIALPFAGTAQEKATWFINNYLNEFNVPVNDLRFRASTVSEKHNNVKFSQTYQGLDVLFSDVYIKMTRDGKAILFGLDCFNNINISTVPPLSQQAAENFATANVTGVTAISTTPALKILPVPQYRNYVFKLVYEIMVSNTDDEAIPGKYYTLIDAMTGEVLYRQNRVNHVTPPAANIDVNMTGTYFLTHNYNPSTVNPLKNMKIIVNGTNYYTDQTGYLGLTNTSSVSANIRLEGLWSSARTNGTVPSWTTTLNLGANNILYDPHANIQEMSAYGAVNVVHDYMKLKFPAFTDMDFPLPTNVDVSGTCNAFYNGTSINFYEAGGGCNATATVADVCYHEYGHGINDFFYSSQGGFWENGAMGEGYADIWALGITESPILGIGFFSGNPTGYVRRYDINKKVYPQDLTGEVHADGEIIAGCWWDVGVNLANVQQMMDIYKETYYALISAPDGQEGILFYDILIEALTVDDNDGNIWNGTPHFCEITSGFGVHGIYASGVTTGLNHTEVLAAPSQTPIPVDVTLVNPPSGGVFVDGYYKINGLGAWTQFTLNNVGGNNYSGNIPSQPNGTIVHYYLDMSDTCGTHLIITPKGANDAANPNIPYYILVGFNLMNTQDLESANPGWTIGAPGDAATTGIWIIADPVPSYLDPGSQTGQVQTGDDHTLAPGVKCAITGNAAIGDGAGTQDIDGGKTTITSQVYDLSTYTNPAFTYYRWYSNDQGATPQSDFWQTFISNDGVTYVPVEYSDVSDHSWRRYALIVSDYVTPSATVTLRFVAEDANAGSLIEGGVDDVQLWDEIPVSVNELQSVSSFSVFPNPAAGEINIRWNQLTEENISIRLTDVSGRVVFNFTPQTITAGIHSMTIPTEKFGAGVYLLKLNSESSNVVKKITVMN